MQHKAKLVLAGCLLAAIIAVYGATMDRSGSIQSSDQDRQRGRVTGPSGATLKGQALAQQLQGTWEMFGSQPGMRQIKLINAHHFTWVFYSRVTQRPVTVAGGRCSFDGDTYTEHVEFGSPGVQHQLVGHDQVFKVKLRGNRMIVTGTLSNGMKINEVWRRVE